MSNAVDNSCFECDFAISQDDYFAVCSECLCSYHLGPCSEIAEKTFDSRSESTKKQWRCPLYKVAKQKKKTVDYASVTAIAELQEKVTTMQETLTSLEASAQQVSDKYDEILNKLDRHKKEMIETKQRVEGNETVHG